MTMATHVFENFSGVMSGLSRGTCLSNLKFVSFTVLEWLVFNVQKFMGVNWTWPRPLSKNF